MGTGLFLAVAYAAYTAWRQSLAALDDPWERLEAHLRFLSRAAFYTLALLAAFVVREILRVLGVPE